jgi:hypothetical protein
MTTTIRLLFCGIAVAYLICIGALFLNSNTALISSRPFGFAVLLFVGVAFALHVGLVVTWRSWGGALAAVTSLLILAGLLLVALMRVTGDSL